MPGSHRTYFEIVGEISNIEIVAVRHGIRESVRLRRRYGQGRWRKLKGVAVVRIPGGSTRQAELHWYQAHGIGRVDMKIKRFLD